MTDTTITVRVSSELRDRLEAIARETRRSKSFLANEAIERYVQTESEIIEGIRRGMEDARAGRVVPHDEAMRRVRATIARAGRKRA